jgi:hypothetical protein
MQQPTIAVNPLRRTSYVVIQGHKQTTFTNYASAHAFWMAVYWRTPGGFPVLRAD